MRHIQRVALLDGFDARQHPFHEAVIDALLDQSARRAGADFALVEREQHQALDRLVEEIVILGHHILEEDVGGFAAELQRDGDQVMAGILHDQPAGRGLAGKGDLGDAVGGGERFAGLQPEPVDDVQHAGRQQIADELGQHHDADRGLLGGFQDHAIAGGQSRGEFPDRHQDREIPRDDLADDAERLVEMIGDGGLVDFREAAFLGAGAGGEIAEMVDGERNVRKRGLADRLAVIDRLDIGEQVEILLHPVGDAVEDQRAGGHGLLAPGLGGGMGGIERQIDIGLVERAAWVKTWPVMGETLSKYWPPTGAVNLPLMKLS